MSTTSPELRVRPRAAWYLVVVALWVVALVLTVTVVMSVVEILDDGVTPVSESGQITIPAAGYTIYASEPPASRQCLLEGNSGPITVTGLSFEFSTSFNGFEYYAMANTPPDLAPGSYVVSCPGIEPGAQLWVGQRLSFGSIGVRFGIAGIAGFLGLVTLIVLLVRRHTSKAKIRQQRVAATAGYGVGPTPGWPGAGAPPSPYGQQPPYGQGQPPPPYGQGQPPPPYGQGQPPPPYGQGQPPPPYGQGQPPPPSEQSQRPPPSDEQPPPS